MKEFPLRAEDIGAGNPGLCYTLKYSPGAKDKYYKSLLDAKKKAIESLKSESDQYKEYLEKYLNNPEEHIHETDKSFGYPSTISLELVHNHIYYYKGEIKTLDNEMRLLESREYLCEGEVKYLIYKWLGKKVDDYHYEKGSLGGATGGKEAPRLFLTAKAECWDKSGEELVETIRAGGWQVEVEPYEVSYNMGIGADAERVVRKLVRVIMPVPHIKVETMPDGVDDFRAKFGTTRGDKNQVEGHLTRPKEVTPGLTPQATEQLKLW